MQESSKIQIILKNVKNKINELDKIENLSACFNSDEAKINQITSMINEVRKK